MNREENRQFLDDFLRRIIYVAYQCSGARNRLRPGRGHALQRVVQRR